MDSTTDTRSSKVQVPASLDEAIADLNGLGSLLTAKQWSRAAIVYAFTEPDNGARRAQTKSEDSDLGYSYKAFAALGITGLRDEETVAWVHGAWQDAIDDGQAVPSAPGDSVTLPEREFPKHPRTRTSYDGFRAQVEKNPEAVRELVRDEPEFAVKLAQQIIETPSVRHAVESKLAEPIFERDAQQRPPPERDYSVELRRGINLCIPAIRAVQRGEWQPSPAEALLLHAFSQLLNQAASPEGEPQDGLFTQIERYLKEGVM